jgi:4'-phosphopantetheinyl transferase
VSTEELEFEQDRRGKPRLASPWRESPIDFSLSHADEVLMVAIARRRIGVDVERVRRIPDLDAVARVCFTADEQALLDASSQARRHERFFTMWTRKEAWAKATGLGLGATLPSTTPDLPAGWSGAALACPAGYRSAVVIEGELTGVEYIHPSSVASTDFVSHGPDRRASRSLGTLAVSAIATRYPGRHATRLEY